MYGEKKFITNQTDSGFVKKQIWSILLIVMQHKINNFKIYKQESVEMAKRDKKEPE